ncbi:MAG: HAD family phosphatase [Candidatus Cloacimonetes bacterium]|nr:HAD family phosphatase [Candidatus Cloacimonadota bacterium]
MNIRQVIFDLGKVLVDFSFHAFYHKLGYQPGERTLDEANEPIIAFESGKMNRQDFLAELGKIYQFEMSLPEFEYHWCNVFSPIPEMLNLARAVRNSYEIFIFSNTDELHFPYVWQKYPELHIFGDNLMLSYELGAVKPEESSYLNALQKFGLKADECLFIDDRPVNIEVAEKLGMKGIIHRSYPETCRQLTEILQFSCPA